MLSSTGTILAKLDYSTWGILTMTGFNGYDGTDDISYTGKERDASNLCYFNARYNDASIGRFITEDPVRDDMNWFAYCGNNPIAFTDPTGLRTFDDDLNRTTAAEREYNAEKATERKATAEKNRNERKMNRLQSRGGYNMKPIAHISFTGTNPTNGALQGEMIVASARGSVSVPVYAGGNGNEAVKPGDYPNRKSDKNCNCNTQKARDILTKPRFWGSDSSHYRIDDKGNLMHQGDNDKYLDDGWSAGCVSVTAKRDSGKTANSNKAAVDAILRGDRTDFHVYDNR